MKKIQILVLLLLLNAANALWAAQSLDGVVAVVNDDVITQTELNKQVQTARLQLEQSHTPMPSKSQLQKQVLNQLIDQKVETQMAQRFGIDVSTKELSQTIEDIAKRNNLTVEELKNAVQTQGINWSTYQNDLKNQMLVHQVLQRAVSGEINITQQEIDRAKRNTALQGNPAMQYHVADILIALPDEPSTAQLQAAEHKAAQIINDLNQGENFQELAAAQSEGAEAFNGGDLGWRNTEQLPEIFAKKVQSMQPGQIAGPLRAGNGLHVIKLVEVKNNEEKRYTVKTHVRHILINTTLSTDDTQSRKQIEIIRKQITDKNFSEMAKKYSQDTGTASKGGDIGWVTPGILVAPFEQAMNSLALNKISGPVKTEYGWHLIEVLGREQVENKQDYQEDRIRQMLYQRKFEEKAQSWVKRMRDGSFIQILTDDDKA